MFKISGIEFNRNFIGIIIACLVCVLFCVIIQQVGISKYNDALKDEMEFVNIESMKVQSYINYHQYAMFGFRILLRPSPLFILFCNSTTLDDLILFIDNSTRLKPQKHESGKNLFDRPTGGVLDLSWFILVFGGFGFSLWCFFAFRNKEYLKLLMDISSKRGVHLGVIFGRILLMLIFNSIIIFVSLVQFIINGINLSSAEIGGLFLFLFVTVLTHTLLMVMSSAFGTGKNWIKGAFLAGGFFAFVVFLWPEILNEVIFRVSKANMQSVYELEQKKIDLMMKFEKMSYEYVNKFDSKAERIAADKEMGEKWWDTEFGNIEKVESEMMEKTRENSKKFQLWSIFNPVTLYKSSNNELSSKGYNSYMVIYADGCKKQKGFLRFFLDNKAFKPYTKVKPYLSKDDMIFNSKPSLPFYFFVGIILSLVYIVCSILFSFKRFNKFLFPKVQGKTDKLDIQLKKGEDVHIMTDEESNDLTFNTLNGEIDQFDGKITIDGKSIVTKDHEDLYYFPDVQELPGNLSVKSITSLAKISAESDIIRKRLKDIDFESKLRLMLKMAKSFKRKIYVFNLSVPGAYYELIREMRDEFKSFLSKDTLVIYLCSSESAPLGVLNPKISKIFINVKGEFIYKNLPK